MAKRLMFVIVISFIMAGSAWGFDENYTCESTYCVICGKDITYREQKSGPWFFSGSGRSYIVHRGSCGSESSKLDESYYAGRVCDECYGKYRHELSELIEKTGKAWLKGKRQENVSLRKHHQDEYKREKIKSIRDRIDNLKEKLEFYETGKEIKREKSKDWMPSLSGSTIVP